MENMYVIYEWHGKKIARVAYTAFGREIAERMLWRFQNDIESNEDTFYTFHKIVHGEQKKLYDGRWDEVVNRHGKFEIVRK